MCSVVSGVWHSFVLHERSLSASRVHVGTKVCFQRNQHTSMQARLSHCSNTCLTFPLFCNTSYAMNENRASHQPSMAQCNCVHLHILLTSNRPQAQKHHSVSCRARLDQVEKKVSCGPDQQLVSKQARFFPRPRFPV